MHRRLVIPLTTNSGPRHRLLLLQICGSRAQSSAKSYYKVLSIQPDATQDEIKAAFYQKSKEIHPDVHTQPPGDNTEFHELCIAYEALKNKKTRLKHDSLLGLRQNPKNHTNKYYGGTMNNDAPKAWTYAHEDPEEIISTKEKISLILFSICVCTAAIFIIRFEISRRKNATTYRKTTTDYYAQPQVPLILRQNSTNEQTSNFVARETKVLVPSTDSLDKLKTWR